MVDRDKIQFDLIKLANGERILRLTEPQSGLSLEKKLAPADAVVRQKEKLLSAFQAALARVELSAASPTGTRQRNGDKGVFNCPVPNSSVKSALV